jgi:ABC-type phosphate/phosphonate transport system substrate-binding protein
VTAVVAFPASGRIAALPMYDLPGLKAANNALWRAVAAHLAASSIEDVPAGLSRTVPVGALWRHPRLLLAQSCGYPLIWSLRDLVKIVATPRYRAPGCQGSSYRSAIVVAAENPAAALVELRGTRCAANDPTSNSGMNLLRAMIAPLAGKQRFFRAVLWSGSHQESMAMIARDKADIAAIDCVTFEHLRILKPALVAAVRVIGWSDASPGLPLVTAAGTDDRTLAALRAALADITTDRYVAPALEALLIDGFDVLSLDDYQSVIELERRAIALGYAELA